MLFGDSLTERSYSELGWGAGVQHLFQHHADVLCRGFGGYTTRQAVAMLPYLLPACSESPHAEKKSRRLLVATVCFGANDAALPTEKVHVPLAEFEANLGSVVASLKQKFVHVIVITQPPVDEQRRLEYQREKYGDRATGYLERTNSVAGEYAKVALQVAAAQGAASIDLWSDIQAEPEWQSYLSDGLHYSGKGQQFVLKKVTRTLQTLMPAMQGTVLQESTHGESPAMPDFPVHSELNFGKRKSAEYIATYRNNIRNREKERNSDDANFDTAEWWL